MEKFIELGKSFDDGVIHLKTPYMGIKCIDTNTNSLCLTGDSMERVYLSYENMEGLYQAAVDSVCDADWMLKLHTYRAMSDEHFHATVNAKTKADYLIAEVLLCKKLAFYHTAFSPNKEAVEYFSKMACLFGEMIEK